MTTSLLHVAAIKTDCAVCGEKASCKVKDVELESSSSAGMVCDNCIDDLIMADRVLFKTKGLKRPI